MADVVREDVVRVSFEVPADPFADVNKEISKVTQEADKASRSVGKGLGDGIKNSSTKAGGAIAGLKSKIADMAVTGASKIKTLASGGIKGALVGGLKLAATGAGKLAKGLAKISAAGIKKAANAAKELGKNALSAAANGAKMAASFAFKAGAAGVAALGAGIVKITKDAVSAGSELEQNYGGVETLFGDAADTVKNNARNAFGSAQMSANEYMSNVTSFAASLKTSLNGDNAAAAQYADRAMIDMSDNANKMGTDIGSIENAYQGFAKQNYTMLDNLKLGYAGTKEGMKDLIAHAHTLDSSVDANSMSFANIVNAIHAVQQNLGIAGDTAEETDKTLEGSSKALKASWNNLMADMAMGNDDQIGQDIDNLTKRVEVAGNNLLPVIQKVLSKIPQVVTDLISKLGPQLIPTLGDTLAGLVESTITTLPTLAPAIGQTAVSMFDSIKQTITDHGPEILNSVQELIPNLIIGISSHLPEVAEIGGNIVHTVVDKVTEKIPEIIPKGASLVLDFLQGAVSQLPNLFSIGGQILSSVGQGIINSLPEIEQKGPQIIHDLLESVVAALPDLVTGIANFLGEALSHLPELLSGALKGIGGGIMDGIKSWFSGGDDSGNQAGAEAANSIASGITANSGSITSAAQTASTEAANAFQLDTSALTTSLSTATTNFTTDMTTVEQPLMVDAATQTVTATQEPFNSIDLTSSGEMAGQGFANGLASSRPAIMAEANGIAADVKNTINSSLQIHSPSRVADKTGHYYDMGLVRGMERGRKKVLATSQNVAGAVRGTTSPERGVAAGKTVTTNRSRTQNNNFAPAFTLNMNGASASGANATKVRRWIREGIQETFRKLEQSGYAMG
jgi:phage-related protein